MCATLIGGMARLRQDYIREAARAGVRLKVVNGLEKDMARRIGRPDLIIVFTGKVSHAARNQVMALARAENIPVALSHSSGVSSLRARLAGN